MNSIRALYFRDISQKYMPSKNEWFEIRILNNQNISKKMEWSKKRQKLTARRCLWDIKQVR